MSTTLGTPNRSDPNRCEAMFSLAPPAPDQASSSYYPDIPWREQWRQCLRDVDHWGDCLVIVWYTGEIKFVPLYSRTWDNIWPPSRFGIRPTPSPKHPMKRRTYRVARALSHG